jgi:hypothetical protein
MHVLTYGTETWTWTKADISKTNGSIDYIFKKHGRKKQKRTKNEKLEII